MSKHAWIENGVIRDIAPGDPYAWYNQEVAKFYNVIVPNESEKGDLWNGVSISKPAVDKYIAREIPKQWTESDFRTGMTLAEKTKWDSDAVPEIKTVKAELPKERAEASELLDFLVSVNVISQRSAEKIIG